MSKRIFGRITVFHLEKYGRMYKNASAAKIWPKYHFLLFPLIMVESHN